MVDMRELNNLAVTFVNEEIEPRESRYMTALIRSVLQSGSRVIISSGTLDLVLDAYCVRKGISEYHATQSLTIGGLFLGATFRKFHLGKEKVCRLKKVGVNNKLSHIVFYSDSPTDLPLLKYANESWIVSLYKSQNWAKKYRYHEIIIED